MGRHRKGGKKIDLSKLKEIARVVHKRRPHSCEKDKIKYIAQQYFGYSDYTRISRSVLSYIRNSCKKLQYVEIPSNDFISAKSDENDLCQSRNSEEHNATKVEIHAVDFNDEGPIAEAVGRGDIDTTKDLTRYEVDETESFDGTEYKATVQTLGNGSTSAVEDSEKERMHLNDLDCDRRSWNKCTTLSPIPSLAGLSGELTNNAKEREVTHTSSSYVTHQVNFSSSICNRVATMLKKIVWESSEQMGVRQDDLVDSIIAKTLVSSFDDISQESHNTSGNDRSLAFHNNSHHTGVMRTASPAERQSPENYSEKSIKHDSYSPNVIRMMSHVVTPKKQSSLDFAGKNIRVPLPRSWHDIEVKRTTSGSRLDKGWTDIFATALNNHYKGCCWAFKGRNYNVCQK